MKKHTYTTYIALSLIAVIPQVSFAAFDKIKSLLTAFQGILNLTVPIIFGLALIFFFYGLAQFIRSVSDKTIEEGKNKMKWGIIALFVMFSIFGIIKYIGDSVGISTGITGGPNNAPICDPSKGEYSGCESWQMP
jgi:hypothetical protein